MNTTELQSRLDFAAKNTMPCAKLALQWFGKDTFTPDHKADGSPVTIADKTIETELRKRITASFPHDAILGEEFPDKKGTNDYQWVIDPIDGTISFVQAIPLFGTMLACLYKGTPVLGAIAMPCLDELVYAATGLGAFHQVNSDDPVPARVSEVNKLSGALVNTTALTYFTTPKLRTLYEKIDTASKHTRGFPDCYGIVLLATGRVDAVIEPHVALWDIASVPPIIQEAGGIATDITGKNTVHTNSLLAATPKIHTQLLDLIQYTDSYHKSESALYKNNLSSNLDPYAGIQDIFNDPDICNFDIKSRLCAIDKYPAWKQYTYLVLLSEGLIGNGGTPGLFCNDGCIAPRVAEAYEKIGALKHAAWIQTLMYQFGTPYPTDFELINELLINTPEQLWDDSSTFFSDIKNFYLISNLLENVYQEANS